MTDQSKPYTPLTTDNSALVLVDHQVGLMTGVRDYETGELKHNVVALAKAAKVLGIPTVVTTTARDSMWGPTFPELVEVVGGEHIIDRSSVNAWDDPKVAAAIEATGRKKLIRSEEHTSELQSQSNLVCRLLLEKKKNYRAVSSVHPAASVDSTTR